MKPAELPFHAPTQSWFSATFGAPTEAQEKAFGPIARGESTLLIAPTGSGKTLAAFLAALDKLMFGPEPPKEARCKLVYVSPIKALAFDIERNLRAPLAGLAHTAERMGLPFRPLDVAIRTGDTPAEERARFRRKPADILITTPESLFLMLTSEVRETLRSVETLIVDEIHALAPTKRGTHLFLSLERLEALRPSGSAPLQRIGLSATQKPLDEVARLLGGMDVRSDRPVPRPVHVADARRKREMVLTIEVPVDDMADLAASERPLAPRQVDGELGSPPKTIWSSIHPRLVELVKSHRSTMVFVNNRRLAERLAQAINDTAGEPLARAHHGSVAREERLQIEDMLKSGALPCIVATSSLELGLDIGAIDLVVQIEAPPSVASGIQRVGRANHQVGETPHGTLFPKHRGDLLACAEAARRMRDGEIEATHYPRSALDVLAQQVVAMVASEESLPVDELYRRIRGAAPYAELSRSQLEGVLDMLSGRYPSDDFGELRPRLTYDRSEAVLTARKGSKRLAVSNAGVIPDRGLYGVFLAGETDKRKSRRVGELDEEMVFEAREGEVFVLGASSWRIEEITHDRVLVSPAPGQSGKMPFWRGDSLGRTAELGRGIGRLCRELSRGAPKARAAMLQKEHALDARAAENLVRYVHEQASEPYRLPTDRTWVVERFLDEVGDYRVCLLSPFGARVHAPLAIALMEKAKREHDLLVETVWTDDGLVLRFPERDDPPPVAPLIPRADEVEELLTLALAETPLFAAHFRECASRALLLPRRSPTRRAPLWAQRKRAAALLSVATRYRSFPIVLETYRECLQDFFDLPALSKLLHEVATGTLQIESVEVDRPSPFARTLLFNYVGNFMYDTDAPLAERRAAALAVDPVQLRELLGQVDLSELLDPAAIVEVEAQLARRTYPPRDADDLHDLLLLIGDLSLGDVRARMGDAADAVLAELTRQRRAVTLRLAGEERVIAAEDAARYRDGLGAMPPPGLPSAFLEAVEAPLVDILGRYARTHGPFSVDELTTRYPLSVAQVEAVLDLLTRRGRLISGKLHPHKPGLTHVDPDVLRHIKQKSLAALRRETEPVEPAALVRFRLKHHDVLAPRRGESALRAALRKLEGYPVALTDLEQELLPARVRGFRGQDLDLLLASGELFWRGVPDDSVTKGRIALFFRDTYTGVPDAGRAELSELAQRVRTVLEQRGAVFFHDLARSVGGFPSDVLEALWELVWAGAVTNDTLKPLRTRFLSADQQRRSGGRALPGSEGRFSLIDAPPASPTLRRASAVERLLVRHGLVARETLRAEGEGGGFSAVYEVLKAMEDAGKVRRGYFVEGLGAAQFAHGTSADLLRVERDPRDKVSELVLAATDPASPYGVELPFPSREGGRPMRKQGCRVLLTSDGRLLGWLGPEAKSLYVFSDDLRRDGACFARALGELLETRGMRALLLGQIDGTAAGEHPLAEALVAAGFARTSRGLFKRRSRPGADLGQEEHSHDDGSSDEPTSSG